MSGLSSEGDVPRHEADDAPSPETSLSHPVRPLSYVRTMATLRALADAPSTGDALGILYKYLHDDHCLAALAVDGDPDSDARALILGDASALASGESASASYSVVRFPPTGAPHSRRAFRFAFPVGAPTDETLLHVLAGQIGARLEHERLAERAEAAEERARRRINELAAIHEIGQAIDQVELPELLQLISERAARLMDAPTCSLMMVNEQTGNLRVVASHGLSERARASEQPLGEGLAGRVALADQPLLLIGNAVVPYLSGVPLKPHVGSAMLVPLKSPDGKALGVLSIRRHHPAPDFTEDDLRLVSVFASQAAFAITNVRLYDGLKRRATELLKISTLSRVLISTLDLDELLSRVADDILEVVGFDRCCLYMRDAKKPIYSPVAWRGYSPAIGRNPVKEGEGAIGVVARARIPLRFDAAAPVVPADVQARAYLQARGFARSLGTDAFVVVPILTGEERCIGIVVADNRSRKAPIGDEQFDLLSAFVNQAGIALENARLYEEMEENYRNTHRLKTYIDNVFRSIGAGIIATDAEGNIVRWNRAAQETLENLGEFVLHLRLGEMIARMRLPENERAHLAALFERAQVSDENIHLHKLTLHPVNRSTMTIDLMLSPLVDHNAERAGVVAVFDDVTQETQLEAELDKMRRLADIGQFAAKMAHEVRNALSPIKGAAQILRLEAEAQSVGTEWPDIIIAEADNLSHLTSEMLDFARPMPMTPQALSPDEFLRTAVLSLSAFLAEHGTRVCWELDPGLPELVADPVHLGQVVRNIVMNAAQAMPHGGDLFIDASLDSTEEMLAIRFRDSGPGIREDDLERIFRPFVTTKTKGTGLGLPIVQKIVDHHGGKVRVESRLGVGTVFTVLLPLRPPRDLPETIRGPEPVISPQSVGPYPDR